MASTHILLSNELRTVFLLDVPTSIAEAQGAPSDSTRILRSTTPRTEPYSNDVEPRTDSATKKTIGNTVEGSLHDIYADLINDALASIFQIHRDSWCSPRQMYPDSEDGNASPSDALIKELAGFESIWDDFENKRTPMYWAREANLSSQDDNEEDRPGTPWDAVFENPSHRSLDLYVTPAKSSALYPQRSQFLIPPTSNLLLTSASNAALVRSVLRSSDLPYRRFDLVLLDPPWPNASARRKGDYEHENDLHTTRKLLYGLDVDMLVRDDGFVAIWITNRRAVRDFVLGRDGISGWLGLVGLTLEEEWIWVKTTTSGECVTSLQGAWRKPYEILLIARKRETFEERKDLKRRVIAAVPDLHSRKPCLKALFSELLFAKTDHCVLEVFARYMVAGWWSWGLEALKFNAKEHWV